ncbi:serine/threonine protein kinase [Nocardiopsis listeri]|uniref:serine/threonine protein kinase n=1 Tax=Nocardiopsis listeri TaxID=53440 RepID=UPI00083440DF|nr:protein kinase [Nocardiopsis listeri]
MSTSGSDDRLAPGYHSPQILYRGASSTLYLAGRDGDDTTVVLKVVRDEHGRAEVERARELSDLPGMIRVIGTGETSSGRAFAVLEHHPEGDYAAALADRGPLPLAEVLTVARSVADTLRSLHERGLLHHGVEPANLLRAPGGAALTDAGGVLPIGERPGPVAPDPMAIAHTPPEILRGEPGGPASDVHRLGTTLWTLLAGHPPFAQGPDPGLDPFAYRDKVLATDPPRLPRADLPAGLRSVLERAVAREPDERYPDAAAFADALAAEDHDDEVPTAPEPVGVDEFLRQNPDAAWAALPGWSGGGDPRVPGSEERRPATETPEDGEEHVEVPTPPRPPEPLRAGAPSTPSVGRPWAVMITVAAVVVLAFGLGAVAVLRPDAGDRLVERARESPTEPRTAPESGAPSEAQDPPAPAAARVEEARPTDVELADQGHTVVVSWIDNTGVDAPHQVIGGVAGQDPGNLADAEPGTVSVRVNALEPSQEYCFIVIAVLGVDEIAVSDEVCTERSSGT